MDNTLMEGEYYLQGQRELASGFLLQPGGKFQFFFSYGALDRQGQGRWKLEKDQLVLDSLTQPTNDFTLVAKRKIPGANSTVKLDRPYPGLVRHVYCSIEEGVTGSWLPLDDDGTISFPAQNIPNVCLLLEFCPERFSKMPIDTTNDNEFIFRMEPSIMQVYFNNFKLTVDKERLTGRHPLLEGDHFSYSKH